MGAGHDVTAEKIMVSAGEMAGENRQEWAGMSQKWS